jgi:hypothetical protein
MFLTFIFTFLDSYMVHIYFIGFLVALVWRFVNIRNNNLNVITDDNPSRYVDNEELSSIKDYEIDWLMLYVECAIGAFFALFMATLFITLGFINKKEDITISFQLVMSFLAIPGYNFFIHSRELFNKYITSKISKSFLE